MGDSEVDARADPRLRARIRTLASWPRRPSTSGDAARDHDDGRHTGHDTTTPLETLIDLATTLTDKQLEAAINEADILRLVEAHRIPVLVDAVPSRPGTARLKAIAHTHRRTDSGLERAMLRRIRRAGLPTRKHR
jgi:hypothetical protein